MKAKLRLFQGFRRWRNILDPDYGAGLLGVLLMGRMSSRMTLDVLKSDSRQAKLGLSPQSKRSVPSSCQRAPSICPSPLPCLPLSTLMGCRESVVHLSLELGRMTCWHPHTRKRILGRGHLQGPLRASSSLAKGHTAYLD